MAWFTRPFEAFSDAEIAIKDSLSTLQTHLLSESGSLARIWALFKKEIGSIKRTISILLRKSGYVFDVKDYGAKGDGVTDDTAAINAAFTAASTRGGVVFGPPGVFRTTSTITMANKDGVSFVGSGMGVTQIYYDPSSPGGTVFTLSGSRWCEVSGIYFNGNSKADTIVNLPRYNTGDSYNQIGHILDKCWISNTRANGVCLAIGDTASGGTQLDNLRVNRCFIANGGTLATVKGNVTFHISFDQTIFSAYDVVPTLQGVYVSDSAGLVYFTKCQFVGSTTPNGMVRRTSTAKMISFSHCEMENIGPMFVGDDDTGFANTSPVTMQNCTWGQVGGVDGTANFGITSGSPICTTASTGNYVVGQRVTGTGIPSQTRILSIQAGVSITLTQNATATNAAASLTITNRIIDYYQHGAVIITAGRMNCSNTSYIEFAGAGTRGVNTGLVQEWGTEFTNVSYLTSGAAQLCRVDQLGNVTFDTDRLTINGSTGTTSIPGQVTTGALFSTGAIEAADSVTAKSATTATVIASRTAVATAASEVANYKGTALNGSSVAKDFSETVTRVDDATASSEDSSLLIKLFRAGVKKTVAVLEGLGILTVTGANQGRLISARENNVSATSEPGTWEVKAPNASGNSRTWLRVAAYVDDATDSSEDASLYIRTASGGSEVDALVTNADATTALGGIKSRSATSGIGYVTGAGGTVSQGSGSGKATGVTMSKVTGQITMDGAALAGNADVTFTLTNTAIAATDVLAISHVSGGTFGAYYAQARCGAGSASINVRNLTAGSLSEAIVLQFVLHKGAAS